jgi:tetratricopeptide (TPR) repeat protein
MDCFSSADPVPNGQLLDSLKPKSMLAQAFDNYHSMLADHTTYLRNQDDFVAQLSRKLMRHARIDCDRIDPDDKERQKVATARRRFRVGALRVGRWVVLLTTVVAIWAWWRNAPGAIDDAVAVVATALNMVPPVVHLFAPYEGTGLGHLPGIVLITLAAALWSLILWLLWASWNRRDTWRRYARKEFPIFDWRPIGFVGLLILGLVSVISWTWVTGDSRMPMYVTVAIAVLCAIVTVAEMIGTAKFLASLRGLYAVGSLQGAAQRLRDLKRRRLQRGVEQKRGWAAFKLGMLVWEEDGDRTLAINYLEQARRLGYSHAAVHLGQILEAGADARDIKAEPELRRAIEYYEIGIKRRNPYCAWFKGLLQEKLNELDAAQETFRVGLELLSPHCGHKLGRLLMGRGEEKGAIEAYERGIKLGDATSAFDLAEIRRQQAHAIPPPPLGERRNLLLQSAVNFRKALQWGEIRASVNLGDVLLEIDDIVGAREAYTAGMELRHLPAAFKLGQLAVREQEYESAQQVFERCAELADDHAGEALAAEAHYELARLFEAMGRHAAAKRSYRRALASVRGSAVAPAPLPQAGPVHVAAAQPASAKQHVRGFIGATLARLGKALEAFIGLLRRPKRNRAVNDAPASTTR